MIYEPDGTEKRVKEYLINLGFINIEYEPNGEKKFPDFAINESIAVEVRKLNIHYEKPNEKGSTYAHEQHFYPVWQGLEKLLKKFGSSIDGETWAVGFSLAHPFNGWKRIKREVKNLLELFKASEIRIPMNDRIQECIKIDFIRCGSNHQDFYIMGCGSDDEVGYWVIGEIHRNLEIVIKEKEPKIYPCRDQFSEFWLVLVDYIGYGISVDDLEQLRAMPKIESNWNKVIVISPQGLFRDFEI